MAWRRYPKYEKKIKTYKDYTHLNFKEIENKQKYFNTKKKDLENIIKEASKYARSLREFSIKIHSDPVVIDLRRRIEEASQKQESLKKEIIGLISFSNHKASILDFIAGRYMNKEGTAKESKLKEMIKYWEDKEKDLRKQKSKSFEHNYPKIPEKVITIYKEEISMKPTVGWFELIGAPGETWYDTEETIIEDYMGIKAKAKKHIGYINTYLEPINKAYEIVKKRHDINESKIYKAKEEASKYKAHAYAHQQKTRDLSEEIKKEIKDQENIFPVCPYCEQSLGLEPHADHIYPVTLGGLGTKDNMVYVCSKCNQSKGALTLREFVKKKGLDRDRVENNLSFLGKKF